MSDAKQFKVYPYKPRKDEWICIHPWSQVAITPDSSVRVCCHTKNAPHLGNLKNNTLEEIFNNERMRTVRKLMLDNKVPIECIKCKNIEDMNAKSPRIREHERWYSEEIRQNYIYKTKDDGTADYNLKYWDMRFSNVCNMSCVMCNSDWSSLWTKHSKDYIKSFSDEIINSDANLRFMRHQTKNINEKITSNPDFQWIDKHFDQVENIYFAGGEPMIMPSHWYILEKLHSAKRFDVKVKYNTNMLKLGHQGKHALDYWKDWPYGKLIIEASIDETGDRAEWIRYGTDWKRVQNNIITVRDAGIRISPIVSVGVYNITRLPELLTELYDLFKSKISINIVFNPEWTIENIDRQERIALIEPLKKLEYLIADRNQMDIVYHKLDQPQIPATNKHLKMLMARCALLDTHRKTNSMELFPELARVNSRMENLYEKKKAQYYV